MKNFFTNKKGFTLIELMIVIAIIAILAAILVPNFVRARAQAQLSACESNEKNSGTALEMYSTDNGGNYITGTDMSPLSPNYLKNLPVCPTNAASYVYTGTVGGKYTISQGGSNAHSIVVGAGPGSLTSPVYASNGGLTI